MTAQRSPRVRRERNATESLLSVALLLESFLFFFLALVLFALRVLPPATALGGGGVLFAVTLGLSRIQGRRWAIAAGWMLQAVIIATGLLEPLMFLIGAGFAALWIFCFVTGRRLDRRNAALRDEVARHPSDDDQTPFSTTSPDPGQP